MRISYLSSDVCSSDLFALGMRGLGPLTEEGSGLLIMAIAGGALVIVQGWLADLYGLQMSFLLTAACELYILFYALWGSKPVVSGEVPAAVEPPGMVPSDAT